MFLTSIPVSNLLHMPEPPATLLINLMQQRKKRELNQATLT